MNDHRTIEQYVKKALSAEERVRFEAKMHNDQELRETVGFYQDLTKVVQWKGAMEEANAELLASVSSGRVRRLGVRQVLAYAASLLFLVSGGLLWFSNANYNNTALANLDVQKLNLYQEGVDRSTRDSVADPLAEGIVALEAQNYTDALQFFGTIPTDSPSYGSSGLLSAYVVYLQADYAIAAQSAQYAKAANTNKLAIQKAEWLIIQSKLRTNQTDSAFSQLLAKIAIDDTHLFQNEAQTLQNQLDSFWRRFLL